MPHFVISDEVKNKSISEIGFSKKVENYLCEQGYKTVREVIDNQSQIDNDIFTSVKAKLIFNLDL